MRRGWMWGRWIPAFAALATVSVTLCAQMPDVRQMSGIPMPSGDVPAGTIVVRVIRGDLSNNVSNQPVELRVGGQVQTSRTDENGRATFANLPTGADAHAVTTVDGERIESGHMELGPGGGIRVMLVAGVGAGAGGAAMPPAAAADPGAPAVTGEVTFGGQSRIQIEFDDDQIEVFYLFEVVNRGSAPVNPKTELVLTLPDDAQAAAMLEGSSTQAQVRGRVVSITGPFAPGSTPVQIAFGLPGGRANRELVQPMPAAWDQVQVIVPKVGNVQMASEQFASNAVMPNEGHSFQMGTGPTLPAGRELRLSLSGLPTRSRAGRWFAILLAALILGVGAWSAYGGTRVSAADARRAQLEARRQKLMGDLARVEEQRRSAGDTDHVVARRHDIMTQLERVYGELDQHGSPSGMA